MLAHLKTHINLSECHTEWGGVVITGKRANLGKDENEAEADLTSLQIVAALASKPLCQADCHQLLFSRCLPPLKLTFECPRGPTGCHVCR